MIVAICAGWLAAVALVMVLAIRPWRAPAARAPLPWLLAAVATTWVLATGADALSNTMAHGSWTAASVTIGIVPIKAMLYALLAYAAGRTFVTAREKTDEPSRRWVAPVLLGAVLLLLIGSDVRVRIDASRSAHAASTALTSDEIAVLSARVRSGDTSRDEQGAFLGNPLCPAELLAIFAASPDANTRVSVAKNPKLDVALAERLVADSEEMVRFMLAFHRDLPPALLSRLAADQRDSVRNIVVWNPSLAEEDFERLTNDPSGKVRATAALQPRISQDALARLRDDPDENVRNAANRRGG